MELQVQVSLTSEILLKPALPFWWSRSIFAQLFILISYTEITHHAL